MYNKSKKYSEYNNSSEYNEPRVWYKHAKGFIIKSWVDPKTNLIVEERMPYNQPNHYLHFLDNYFKYNLR